MAADYIFPEGDLGLRTPGSKPRRRAPDSAAVTGFDKFLRVLIILAVLFLAGVLVWLLGVAPFRAFSKIDIAGAEDRISIQAEDTFYYGVSRKEILAKAGLNNDSSFFSTDARIAEKALMGFASFESVRVFKHFPDKLQIVLEGRKAAASALAVLDGRAVPVLFDSNGVVFQIGAGINDETLRRPLPLISGFIIDDPVPGMRLPAIFTSLFKELEKIEDAAPELLAAVSELRISRRSFDGFDVVLYPVNKRVKVSLSEINEDLLRYTLLMVDVLASRDPMVGSLDFRSGIASYKPLEVSSE